MNRPEYDHLLELDGIKGFVWDVKDEGLSITVCGWDYSHHKYKKGDRVILKLVREDGRETRYKVKNLRSCGDPRDMYFLDLKYFPRLDRK